MTNICGNIFMGWPSKLASNSVVPPSSVPGKKSRNQGNTNFFISLFFFFVRTVLVDFRGLDLVFFDAYGIVLLYSRRILFFSFSIGGYQCLFVGIFFSKCKHSTGERFARKPVLLSPMKNFFLKHPLGFLGWGGDIRVHGYRYIDMVRVGREGRIGLDGVYLRTLGGDGGAHLWPWDKVWTFEDLCG